MSCSLCSEVASLVKSDLFQSQKNLIDLQLSIAELCSKRVGHCDDKVLRSWEASEVTDFVCDQGWVGVCERMCAEIGRGIFQKRFEMEI